MRIATWNLDHASNSSRPVSLQVQKIAELRPDILVLTETCGEVIDRLSGHQYASFTSSPNKYGKYYSSIHLGPDCQFRESLQTFDGVFATCVRASSELGELIIYGTIITYHGDRGSDPKAPSPVWHEHYKSIEKHGNDWSTLPREIPLVVAGDFNQTRDNSSQSYGTSLGRAKLSQELDRNGLSCLTTENFGASGKLLADPRKGWPRNNVDHICATSNAFLVRQVGAWDHFLEDSDGVRYMSDHNGVYVDLAPLSLIERVTAPI